MIKSILFDIDGVIINRGEYYSRRYAKEANVPLEDIEPFFKNIFSQIVIGKGDLKQEIKPYLKTWKWKGSVADFLDKWFHAESNLNQTLLNQILEYRNKGVICCIQSTQEKYRAEYILKTLKLKNYFDKAFFSGYLGFSKPDPIFFESIWVWLTQKHKLKDKKEVLFVDDEEKNISAANEFGFKSLHFTSNRSIQEIMRA